MTSLSMPNFPQSADVLGRLCVRANNQNTACVTLYAISLCHALIFPSFLPYLYDQTALPQSTGLTSAVATISILSSLFP
jgi:hypothetical protein